MGYFTNRRRDRVVDDNQVIVGVQWQVIGVKRPFRLPGSPQQFLGKCTWDEPMGGRDGGDACAKILQEPAPGTQNWINACHGNLFRW
jgi:hypothetical protein